MQRDLLLVTEMIDVATQAIALVGTDDAVTIAHERQHQDALLWNSCRKASSASPHRMEAKIVGIGNDRSQNIGYVHSSSNRPPVHAPE